jgi:hypothetical protein
VHRGATGEIGRHANSRDAEPGADEDHVGGSDQNDGPLPFHVGGQRGDDRDSAVHAAASVPAGARGSTDFAAAANHAQSGRGISASEPGPADQHHPGLVAAGPGSAALQMPSQLQLGGQGQRPGGRHCFGEDFVRQVPGIPSTWQLNYDIQKYI